MDTFEFRKHLYRISNHLSTSEVKNLKFFCSDVIPRQRLERFHTGFDLFCALEDQNCVTPNNTAFLQEILSSVNKGHLVNQLGGRATSETGGAGSQLLSGAPLDKTLKRKLVKLGEELSDRNLRDVALFFVSSGTQQGNLSVQAMEDLRQASDLFQRLEDSGALTPAALQRFREVLQTIGRIDVCQKLDNLLKEQPPHGPPASTHNTNQSAAVGNLMRPVQEEREPDVHSLPSGNFASRPGSLVTPTADYTGLFTGTSSSSNSTTTSIGSGPPTSFQQYRSGFTDSGSQPESAQPPHAPISVQSKTGGAVFVPCGHGTYLQQKFHQESHQDTQSEAEASLGRHPRTAELVRLVEEKDGVIDHQQREIEELRREREKIYTVASQQDKIKALEGTLATKIGEVESVRKEAQHLRDQLLMAEDVPLYEMNSQPHGLALIIVNETFDPNPLQPELNLEPRDGARKDLEMFSQTFRQLGYQEHRYYNIKGMEMFAIIDQAAKEDHSNYDSFVCCVSTHGDEHMMYGADSVGVKRAEFIQPLKHCESLQGKPKMFFFQACRVPHLPIVSADNPTERNVSAPSLSLDADIFIANATTAKNFSFRSPRDGSWFVTALHRTFTTQAFHRTLFPMMYDVNAVICDSRGVLESHGKEVIQCAEWTTSFRRGVRFHKPLPTSSSS